METTKATGTRTMDAAAESLIGGKAVWDFLHYACGREIFCSCGRIHDVSRAVHVEMSSPSGVKRQAVCCTSCWDKTLDDWERIDREKPGFLDAIKERSDVIYGPAFTRSGQLKKRLPSPWRKAD